MKPKKNFLPSKVETVFDEIEIIAPDENKVRLGSGREIAYDLLVVATGAYIRPDEIEGLTGDGWRKNIFDFYTPDGAAALGKFLSTWQGGRLVINVAEMPIKCPVAPLEFLFLADWYFQQRGIRSKVELVYATPLPGAFTKPKASAVLGDMLTAKGIHVEKEFNISEVDGGANVVRSYDGRELPYDLFVTIPTNMGAEVIERSGMGDELNFVPVNKHSLQSKGWKNVFVIGDASNAPASKAGSVAHFQADTLVENLVRFTEGGEMLEEFDGHANCFIESGHGKAFLIDFNYDVEPLPGVFPLPVVGPMALLKETRLNHLGKMGFRWIYWNILLRGLPMPMISHRLSMTGKQA